MVQKKYFTVPLRQQPISSMIAAITGKSFICPRYGRTHGSPTCVKSLFTSMITMLMLCGCSAGKLPPFASAQAWTLDGNKAVSSAHDLTINFGGKDVFPITNMSDGGYDLNFITGDAQFQAYDPRCKEHIASAIRQIPLNIDSLEFVLADQFIVFTPRVANSWMPDLVRQADGTELVVEANPRTSTVQPHDEIWRNFIFDGKRHRILVIDRLVKNGKHIGIVYLMQSEDKKVPFSSTIHYDVTAPRNVQPVGEHMRALFDITIDAALSHAPLHTYNDYIHAADSCFMAGDYLGASRQFSMAFATGNTAQGPHLYNAACAAALAGDNDVAFARLNARLSQEPDWYVDDPAADTDLASLHDDARWQVYSDSLIARRDRIEARFDKALRAKLLSIARSDQDIRHEFLDAYRATPKNQARIDSLSHEMQRIDSINQAQICQILDTDGFAGKEKVGNASSVFWLIIQHSPVEMQKRYFGIFEQAARHGDISLESIAMMDDRIAMFEGRPQKYGSQIVDGHLYPLQDPAQVDRWRQEMGMPPLADYLKQMGISL